MKRISIMILLLVLIVSLSGGCSDPSETPTTSPSLLTQTEDGYVIFLPKCNQTVTVYKDYVQYLTYVSEELIHNADTIIAKILQDNPEDYPYVGLTINTEGYLCLYTELIVYLEPGDEGQPGGCPGHDHIYYKEPITTQPVK